MHLVWVHSGIISSLFGISYSSWDPQAIELCSLNMCYFIPFNFKLSDVSTSVLCFEEEKAEQTQTPRARTPKGIWMLEGALGHITVHVLSQIQPALPDEHSQSCSGAVSPGSTASTQELATASQEVPSRGRHFSMMAPNCSPHTGLLRECCFTTVSFQNPCTKLPL